MKKIFAVFRHDIKKIFNSVIAFTVIIGLSVLPALYAWFNIASNWNPYDNSGNIPVAVVNLDKGCEIGSLKLSFGDDIVDNLKKNTQMGWDFVDSETADKGIIEGDYYAVVVISEDFSENLTSIATGELKSPEITYIVNEKKNAIAPKITDKGIQAIETEVNTSFVAELTDIAATLLNTSSDEVTESKDEICDKIISALDDSQEVLESLETTVEVISDGMTSAKAAVGSNKSALTSVDRGISEASDLAESVSKASSSLSSASSGLSETLDGAASSVRALTSSLEERAADIADEAKTDSEAAADDLRDLRELVSEIEEITGNAAEILESVDSGSAADGLSEITSDIEKYSDEISQLVAELDGEIDTAFSALSADASAISEKLEKLENINNGIIKACEKLTSALNTLSESYGTDVSAAVSVLALIIEQQNEIIAKIDSVSGKIGYAGALPSNLKSELDAIAAKTKEAASSLSGDIETVLSAAGSGIGAGDAAAFLRKMNTALSTLGGNLDSAAETLESAGTLPESFNNDVTSLAEDITADAEAFEDVYLEPAKAALKELADESAKALDKASGVLSSADTSDIETALDSAQEIISAFQKTLSGIEKLIESSIDGISSVRSKVQGIKENTSVENLISTVFSDPEAVSEFISSPVKINTEEVFPVEDYGSAMAPFYTVLALWVGGIVLVAVLKTDLSKSDRLAVGSMRPIQEYFGRYSIFLVISLLQATIVALGDVFFMGIQCDNLFLFMLTNWITIIVFSLLIYSLTISFSVIGKAVSVILLIIQVAGSGGTFPPELLPQFFQNLIRFMPFNYAINAMRETVAGVTYSAYWENILYLLCFIPAALVIGILFRRPCMRAMKFFNRRLEETDLIL